MVDFGKKLIISEYQPWAALYVDYDQLKAALRLKMQLNEAVPLRKTPSFISFSPKFIRESLRSTDEDPFQTQLDNELEKCVLFFLSKQGELADGLTRLRSQLTGSCRAADLNQIADNFRSIGEQIVLLIKFAELNLTAIHKIIKKHDKNFRNEPLADKYRIESNISGKESPIEQLCHFGGISALISSVRRGLLDAAETDRLQWEASSRGQTWRSFQDLPFHDASLVEYDPIFAKLERARARLRDASPYMQNLAAVSLFYIQEPEGDGSSQTSDADVPPPSPASRVLNNLSAFLYMGNYYIVAPTSGMYATRLGGSEADSAMIIGMTPLAAQAGAILFSWWANKGYKNPLIFAACCTMTGNLLYALALPYNSLSMVLAGRLLNGFGAARAINRRYIADAYRKDERTAASALFVTSSSLGMAAGPFVSALVGLFLTDKGNFLTIETAPGWIMTFVWGVYLVLTLIWFKEPTVSKPSSKHGEKLYKKKSSSTVGEKKSLLPLDASSGVENNDGSSSFLSNVPVLLTLLVYFVLKLVLECLLSSTAMLTSHYFNWHKSLIGLYLSFLGMLMFPTNVVVARYSRFYDDRELVVFFLTTTAIGVLSIAHYVGERYTEAQYILGAIFIFCSTNSLEGVNMSLLSKTIPKAWAKHGILNSGLLATESGTFGRTLGAFFLTWCAKTYGVNHLLNYAFVPVGVFVFLTLSLVMRYYDFLSPMDDDDE